VVGDCSVYPWMVRLTVDGSVCGGTIIDATHVLTAAHCVVGMRSITAVVGEYDANVDEGTEQTIAVDIATGVAVKENYNALARTNDIAVLTLTTPLDLTRPCATPICLDPAYQLTSGQTCTVAGWGVTDETSFTPSQFLQSVSVPTFNGSDCPLVFPEAGSSYFSDVDMQLCAGQPSLGGVDSCAGDSGGPLFCLDAVTSQWLVVGVVSYGEGCARAGFPGVYSKVSAYSDWITAQL